MTFTHQKGNTYKDSIGEKFVSHIWESGHFVKFNLKTKDGRIIEVLHPGQWNNDAGADFTDAAIDVGIIGNEKRVSIMVVKDVETQR